MGNSLCTAPPAPEPEVDTRHAEAKPDTYDGPAKLPTVLEDNAGVSPLKEADTILNKVEEKVEEATQAVQSAVASKSKMDLTYEAFVANTTPEQKAALEDIKGTLERRPSTVGTDLTQYAEKHGSTRKDVLDLHNSQDWVFKKQEAGVDIWTMTPPGETLCAFKGQTTIKVPKGAGMQHVFFGLLKVDERPKWDDMCLKGQTLECYLPFYRISYYQIKSPVPIISDRDTAVVARGFYEDDGSIIIAANSIQTDMAPLNPKFVRFVVHLNAFIIKPTADPDEFVVTVVGRIDPCGWLPMWFKNLVMWKQALALGKLKKYLSPEVTVSSGNAGEATASDCGEGAGDLRQA